MFRNMVLVLMLLISPAFAYQQGDESTGSFTGCDTVEDAKAFFTAYLSESTRILNSCGLVQGAISVYVRELTSFTVRDYVVTIHEVAIANFPGIVTQYVATIKKAESA